MSSPIIFHRPKSVLVIGAVNRDIKARCCDPIVHLADSNSAIISQHDGGVGRNIADVLGRLEMPTTFITAFGSDDVSQAMRAHLESYHIDLRYALTMENMRSDMFISIHDVDGELLTAVNQMTLIKYITPAYVQSKEALITAADFVICDCNLPQDTMAAIAKMPRRGKLVIDAVSASKIMRIRDIVDEVDILKVSRIEALSLCGAPIESSAESLVLSLCDLGIGQVIVSDGPKGFYINNGNEIHHFEAITATPQTVTGAGDCLLAGYIYSLANGDATIRACEIGRQAAFLSTKSVASVNNYITLDNIIS